MATNYEDTYFPAVIRVRGSDTEVALDECLIVDGYVVAPAAGKSSANTEFPSFSANAEATGVGTRVAA